MCTIFVIWNKAKDLVNGFQIGPIYNVNDAMQNAIKSNNNLKPLYPVIYFDGSYKETAGIILLMALCDCIEPIH